MATTYFLCRLDVTNLALAQEDFVSTAQAPEPEFCHDGSLRKDDDRCAWSV